MSEYNSAKSEKKPAGRLYGVGIGPGNPELVTLRAYNILLQVSVIFVPKKSEQSGSIAESIINSLTPKINTEIKGLVLPMLRNKEHLKEYWDQAADTIWHRLRNGEDCAFVNIGDPLLYGTFVHIMQTLRKKHNEIKVEVVPGISSINAAAADAVVPLASDDERIAIISGNRDEFFIKDTLKNFDTIVFMKINSIFDKLLVILEELNLTDKCVYLSKCTMENEEIVYDINTLKGEKIDYFSLLIVRK